MTLMHDDLLSTDEGHPGLLYFGGARMAMLDVEAGFWGLRRQLEALVGQGLADAVLEQAGANGGASFARTYVGRTDDAQALRDCVAAYQAAGFGQYEIIDLEWPLSCDPDEPAGRVLIRAHDAFEAWAAGQHGQSSDSPLCAYTAGVLVGFVNVLAGRRDVVCIERACQAQGAEACEFELLPAEAAGDVPVVALARDPALGRQLNLLELLFDRMPMGIAVLDREYHIQRYNPTWEEFAKRYAPLSAVPLAPGIYYFNHLPGTEATVIPLFERALDGETVRLDAVRLESEGIVTYWDVVLAPIVEDGEVTGILNVTIDATGRMQVRQELETALKTLRKREERLTLVMEGINDGVWDWDLESDEVYFSPRWKSMLGYAEDEIQNEFAAWEQMIHPDDRERASTAIREHLDGHTPLYRLEHRLRHRDGVYRWILARGRALRREDGTPYRLVGSHTDITERRLAEEALRASEAHMRSLLENARNFAVYRLAVDPSEPHGARVILVSPSMQELMGIDDPYDFRLWFEVIHPDDLPRVLAANEEAIRHGVPYSETVRCYHQGRKAWIWVQTTSTPVLDDGGQVTHFNGLVLDVTDQKRAEEALHYRAAFENVVSTISTDFINMSLDEIDFRIHQALKTIGQFTGVDRSYVFRFAEDLTHMDCTHEWSAPGIEPQIEAMQDVPVDAFAWSNDQLLRGEILYVPRVANLPPEAEAEREEFQRQEIQSLVVVPMVYRGSTVGFVGFDSVREVKIWPEDNIQLLRLVAAVFANALEHRRAQAIQAGQRQFLELLATGGDFSETLHTLVRIIEEQWPGMLGLVLLLDEDGCHLHVGASVSLPQAYVDSIEGLEIGPMVGSCGTASYTRKRVIVEDIDTDPRWEGLRELAQEYGLRACWSEPVLSPEGEVVGTFAMYYRHPRAPTEAELRTIETAAHLVGVAVEHKRAQEALHEAYATLEQRVEERTRELATLLQVSHDVSSTLELGPLLELILDQLKVVVDYTGASILIQEGEELVARAYRGPIPEEEARQLRFSLEEALVNRHVIRRREPIVIQDVLGHTPLARLFQQSAGGELGLTFGYIRSWMGVPLIVRNEVLGMLTLDHSQPGFLTDQHANLVLAFANQVAVAIENARLYEHAEEAAVAAERNRLARDLHDAVTQTLFSSTLIAEVLPRIWERDQAQGQQRLQELRELTRGALAEMRTLLLELRPAALEEAELGDLLRQLAESITGRARVPVALEVEGACEMAAEIKIALYRIAQEALNNVAKHAGATQAKVILHCFPPGEGRREARVELDICDDGVGFDPSVVGPNSLGLGIMRERAETIGAGLRIESAPGEGTQIKVTWRSAQ